MEGISPTEPEILRNQYWNKIKIKPLALFQTKYVMLIPITANFSKHVVQGRAYAINLLCCYNRIWLAAPPKILLAYEIPRSITF